MWTALCPDIPQSRAAEFWGDGVRFYGCEPEQAYIGTWDVLERAGNTWEKPWKTPRRA